MGDLLTKDYAVFDCDAHIIEPIEIWTEYVPEVDRELVRKSYWRDNHGASDETITRMMAGNATRLFNKESVAA